MKTHGVFPMTLFFTAALVAAYVIAPATSLAGRRDASLEPPEGPLDFVQDDYAKALSLARAQSAPLFVEFWAPW
jgi:hypothetical protein